MQFIIVTFRAIFTILLLLEFLNWDGLQNRPGDPPMVFLNVALTYTFSVQAVVLVLQAFRPHLRVPEPFAALVGEDAYVVWYGFNLFILAAFGVFAGVWLFCDWNSRRRAVVAELEGQDLYEVDVEDGIPGAYVTIRQGRFDDARHSPSDEEAQTLLCDHEKEVFEKQ